MVKEYSKARDGETKVTANFKVKEFASKCGADKVLIDINGANKLQAIRDRVGQQLILNSAYRTPEHNKKVGGATNSLHVTGQAFDVKSNVGIDRLAKEAQSIGFNGIIKYTASGFVHMDTRSTKYYAIDNGKTVTKVNGF